MPSFEIRRIAGALGAEVHGIDLSKPLSRDLAAELRAAWLEHLVLFFREQALAPSQFMDFACAWGKPIEYPFVRGMEGFPEIIEVKKLEHEKVNFGGIWHSDTAYLDEPPMASMLLAREVPPAGGDTLFANQYLAWESLSDGMRFTLEKLRGVNLSSKADVSRTREDRVQSDGRAEAKREYVAVHPVARTHPETGRKALYVNVAHTARFDGMTDEESRPLIDYLVRHATKPEFVYRHMWRKNDILVWDNRCTMHQALGDFDETQLRHMERTTVLGTPSGYTVAGG